MHAFRALALAASVLGLVNDTSAAPRRDRTESGACSIHKTPAAQQERKYFILFTRPHSGADLLCKLLNRHPEITCAGEPFNPSTQPTPHQTADRLGWTVAEQRAVAGGDAVAESTAAGKRSKDTVKAGEKLIEAIELVRS